MRLACRVLIVVNDSPSRQWRRVVLIAFYPTGQLSSGHQTFGSHGLFASNMLSKRKLLGCAMSFYNQLQTEPVLAGSVR